MSEDKKKNNYNLFSKQELVEFFIEYESNFMYMSTPFDIIIKKKIKANMNERHRLRQEDDSINIRLDELSRECDQLEKLRIGEAAEPIIEKDGKLNNEKR